MISTVICTLDEEVHIARCVGSVIPLGPVFVVDCGSADDTVRLAREAGAIVVHQDWLGYAAQKNWALDNLPIETVWVLLLDADETVPPELAAEILTLAREGTERVAAYYLARRNIFLGRELKHVWWYPDYQLRLFRHGRARFEDRAVHEFMRVDGASSYLVNALVHENLKGISAFWERHLRYAQLEAAELHAREVGRAPAEWRSLPGWRAKGRRLVKIRLWAKWPQRPLTRFLWLYVVKRGYLDGRQGRVYAQLISAYEGLIDAYLEELRMSQPADHPATP